jgi:hypothetical protein
VKWAYGVTTVPSRRRTLLPVTLESLRRAGFNAPRLFVDGAPDGREWAQELGLEVTARYPPVRTVGNWLLSLWELYIRQPNADRYAIFQDDFVTYHNLRGYLEKSPYPDKGYLNLYTFPSNQSICPTDSANGKPMVGWYLSNQYGRGAVALVFDRAAAQVVISSRHLIENKLQNVQPNGRNSLGLNFGQCKIDGGIIETMVAAGYREYVHNPSLVQHTGIESSMGNKPQLLATSFRGENFNALELLQA